MKFYIYGTPFAISTATSGCSSIILAQAGYVPLNNGVVSVCKCQTVRFYCDDYDCYCSCHKNTCSCALTVFNMNMKKDGEIVSISGFHTNDCSDSPFQITFSKDGKD